MEEKQINLNKLMTLLLCLTTGMATAKICGMHISWVMVLCPLWIFFVFVVMAFAGLIIFAWALTLYAHLKNKFTNRKRQEPSGPKEMRFH